MFSNICRQFAPPWQIWGHFVSRQYTKGLLRQPLKVFSLDGKEMVEDPPVLTSAGMRQPRDGRGTSRDGEGFTSTRDALGDMEYTWLKDSDKRLKLLRLVSTQRKARSKKHVVALEGRHLVADALDARANVKAIYFSRVEMLEGLKLAGLEGRLYKVKHSQLEYVTGVASPPGIMALVEMPSGGTLAPHVDVPGLRPITLILDNLRDPGNMGTLLRSAAAVGCHRILLTSGNVDIWDPKVLRAGAGCHFRTHIRTNLKWPTINEFLSDSCTLLLADNHTPLGPHDSEPDSPDLSASLESANYKDLQRIQPVDAFGWRLGGESEVVLVVGGETEGLSDEAYKLMERRGGKAVQLPMAQGIESLNAAMAGTVVMYEVRRQMDAMCRSRDAEAGQ